MSQGREFRGDRAGRKREFDWYAMARERGLSYYEGLRLYGEAQLEASRHRDPERVLRAAYLAQLDRVRPRPQHRIGAGKITRVMLDEAGLSWPLPASHPGTVATTSYLLPRRPSMEAGSPGQHQADARQPSAQQAASYAAGEVGEAEEANMLERADVPAEIWDQGGRPSELSPETQAGRVDRSMITVFDDYLDELLRNARADNEAAAAAAMAEAAQQRSAPESAMGEAVEAAAETASAQLPCRFCLPVAWW